MRQKFTITESERNQIRGLYEQVSTQPQQSGTTSPQSGTTIQTGTTTQSQFKSSHLSQHNTTSQQPVNEQHEIDGEGMNQLNESNTGNIFEPIKDGVLPDGSPYKLFEKKYDGFKLAMVQATKTNKEGNKEILIKCILILPNNVKIDMTVEEFNQDWIRPKGVKDPMVHKLINNAEALGEYKVSMSRVPKMK